MWTFEQLTGKLFNSAGQLVGTGYAGRGAGLNNPAMQQVSVQGPLPEGYYTIGAPYQNPHTGRFTMNLLPDASNQMFGRSLFRIHGDTEPPTNSASDGCIVVNYTIRQQIWNSGDHNLHVVSILPSGVATTTAENLPPESTAAPRQT